MKRLFLILFLILPFNVAFSNIVEPVIIPDITKNVTEAIRKGNYAELATFFNSSIDLTVLGKEGTYSKSQAQQIVKEFFQKNIPKSFNVKHQGKSSDGSNYLIGTLTTNNGNFRVYFLIKTISGKSFIQQLQFEKD